MSKVDKIRAGMVFGSLTVLHETVGKTERRWSCECTCGAYHDVVGYNLLNGHSTRCISCSHTASAEAKRVHPKGSRTMYVIWKGMNSRCHNENHPSYKHYGGRGISVCDDWRDTSPKGLGRFTHSMGDRPSNRHSVDREDNDKDYSPDNCKWSTQKEQTNNTRANKLVTYKGETRNVGQWAELTGTKANTITYRLLRGWSDGDAINGRGECSAEDSCQLIVPLSVFLDRVTKDDRKYLLNLNQYRNWQGHENNNVKSKFKEVMGDQLRGLKLEGEVDVTFRLYKGSNRRTDKSNFYSVLSKFLYDAMSEFECIEDDNDLIIKEERLLPTKVDKEYPRAEFTFTEREVQAVKRSKPKKK